MTIWGPDGKGFSASTDDGRSDDARIIALERELTKARAERYELQAELDEAKAIIKLKQGEIERTLGSGVPTPAPTKEGNCE